MILFDAFLDSYYAWDFNAPESRERLYTTQAQRHNEPNINLAHAGISLKKENIRGRFALQGGNSVTANTSNEANPKLGHIQESYVGVKLGERTWIDAGIYLGHIGMESWISKNNMTYTRSLLLDYVPYYALGARVSHDPDDTTHLEFHVLNGWGNISETNSAKAIGLQVKKNFGFYTLTYNNFLGDEKIYADQKSRFRTYHNFIAEIGIREDLKFKGSVDFGTQSEQQKKGTDLWSAVALVLQKKLDQKNFVAWRAEYYSDPDEANVKTGTPYGFQVVSASINFDHHFQESVLWRTELRGFSSRDKIYPGGKNSFHKYDGALVTSLSFEL